MVFDVDHKFVDAGTWYYVLRTKYKFATSREGRFAGQKTSTTQSSNSVQSYDHAR